MISPDGVKTAFGTSPRINGFEVVYIFQVGRYDIDNTRIYMPLADAQIFFNRENSADEVEITLFKPESIKEELKQKINTNIACGEAEFLVHFCKHLRWKIMLCF